MLAKKCVFWDRCNLFTFNKQQAGPLEEVVPLLLCWTALSYCLFCLFVFVVLLSLLSYCLCCLIVFVVRQAHGKRLSSHLHCLTGKPWQTSSPGDSSFSGYHSHSPHSQVIRFPSTNILDTSWIPDHDQTIEPACNLGILFSQRADHHTITIIITIYHHHHHYHDHHHHYNLSSLSPLSSSGVEVLLLRQAPSDRVFPNG